MTAIPRRLSHIWIGPKPAPSQWMDTWPAAHPGWSYTVFGNDTLTGFPFRLRALMNEYAWRGAWAGVQDMMRYELLFRFGGFMADADAICLHPVDELLDGARAYTVYDRPEDDRLRGVCPILACEPGNSFVGAVIDRLATLSPWELQRPEKSTGNRFLMRMIRDLAPSSDKLRIWPTHYFIPWQKTSPDIWYDGPDRVYAEQKWGTSSWAYNREGGPSNIVYSSGDLAQRSAAILDRLAEASGKINGPWATRDAERLLAVNSTAAQVEQVLHSDALRQEFADLGRTLEAAMERARLPARFQGAYFFRHKQNASLRDSKLITRLAPVRSQLLGWLGSARHALVIGYDTGHLLAAALHLNPQLRIVATEIKRWLVEDDPDPPRREIYVPAVVDWLATRFADRLSISARFKQSFIDDVAMTQKPPQGYDLVMLTDVDLRSAAALEAVRGLLSDDAVIVAASPATNDAAQFPDRLRVQNLIYSPMTNTNFGDGRGSLSAMRLIWE